MNTLCFLPVRVAVQLLALVRIFLAKLAIFWIFFSSPSSVLTGLLGHVVHSLLLDSSLALSLAIPLLATELVADTLLLVGVWRSARCCLAPWLALNSLVILVAGAGVVSLLVPVILPLPVTTSEEEPSRTEVALKEINRSLLIILLNLVLILQMINLSAVVRVLVDMRGKRRVSFSSQVQRKEVPNVNMYEMPPPPPPTYSEDEGEEEEVAVTSSSFESIEEESGDLRSGLLDNPNIVIAMEGQVARESWSSFTTFDKETSVQDNSLKFSLDRDNFA